jgi:hypothetical protein
VFQVAAYRSERTRQLDLRLQRRNPPLGFPGRQVLLELFWLIGLGTEVVRMSAAICGIKDKVPDVATLIRATLAASGAKRTFGGRAMSSQCPTRDIARSAAD